MIGRMGTLFRCQRGNALVIVAAVMPMLIGAGAIGMDVTQWALAKRRLQRTADSAALAGAHALQWRLAPKAAAERDLKLNNQVPFSSTPIIESAPTVGDYKGDTLAVRVHLTTAPTLAFVSYLMSGSTEIAAEATAAVVQDPKYCVLALEASTVAGVSFEGSSSVGLDCGIGTNSQGSPAISAEGASSITATRVGGVGAVPRVSNYSSGTSILSYQPPLEDPYANLPAASTYATKCTGATALVVEGNKKASARPGCYAGALVRKYWPSESPVPTFVIVAGRHSTPPFVVMSTRSLGPKLPGRASSKSRR